MVQRCISSVASLVDDIFVTITKNTPKDDTSKIEKVVKGENNWRDLLLEGVIELVDANETKTD